MIKWELGHQNEKNATIKIIIIELQQVNATMRDPTCELLKLQHLHLAFINVVISWNV